VEIISTDLQTRNKLTVLGQAAVVENWTGEEHSQIVPLVLSTCCFILFLDNPCHHIYCPSKKKCQTLIYYFFLALVHCPKTLFVVAVWLSLKLCLSKCLCLVLPPLLDLLSFLQFQSPPPLTIFAATDHCLSHAQILLSVFFQE